MSISKDSKNVNDKIQHPFWFLKAFSELEIKDYFITTTFYNFMPRKPEKVNKYL